MYMFGTLPFPLPTIVVTPPAATPFLAASRENLLRELPPAYRQFAPGWCEERTALFVHRNIMEIIKWLVTQLIRSATVRWSRVCSAWVPPTSSNETEA
jgi:hypothetical protein